MNGSGRTEAGGVVSLRVLRVAVLFTVRDNACANRSHGGGRCFSHQPVKNSRQFVIASDQHRISLVRALLCTLAVTTNQRARTNGMNHGREREREVALLLILSPLYVTVGLLLAAYVLDFGTNFV